MFDKRWARYIALVIPHHPKTPHNPLPLSLQPRPPITTLPHTLPSHPHTTNPTPNHNKHPQPHFHPTIHSPHQHCSPPPTKPHTLPKPQPPIPTPTHTQPSPLPTPPWTLTKAFTFNTHSQSDLSLLFFQPKMILKTVSVVKRRCRYQQVLSVERWSELREVTLTWRRTWAYPTLNLPRGTYAMPTQYPTAPSPQVITYAINTTPTCATGEWSIILLLEHLQDIVIDEMGVVITDIFYINNYSYILFYLSRNESSHLNRWNWY